MSWYCPLPFTSLSSDTAGYYALCCESTPSKHHCSNMSLKEFESSSYMTRVRQGFKSDDPTIIPEISEACHQCIQKEKQGAISKRQRELLAWEKESEDYFLELKLIGNICNQACRMCAPISSSKIVEELNKLPGRKKIDIPRYYNLNEKWWKDFDEIAPEFNYFKFSGGEPFMSPTFNKILKRLEEIGHTDVKIQVNTNGSASGKKIEKILNTFTDLNMCLSIDAWGKRNEIIRTHSNWKLTEKHLHEYWALVHDRNNFSISIHPCVSILNIGYLNEFEEFVEYFCSKKMQFSVSNTLFTPEELNVYYLPMKLKEQYYNKQKAFLENKKVLNAKSVINILTSPTNEGKHFPFNLKYLDGIRVVDNLWLQNPKRKKMNRNLGDTYPYLKIENWQKWWPEFLEWYEK
jgi:pyruvate-formate lyase-activating enzyme